MNARRSLIQPNVLSTTTHNQGQFQDPVLLTPGSASDSEIYMFPDLNSEITAREREELQPIINTCKQNLALHPECLGPSSNRQILLQIHMCGPTLASINPTIVVLCHKDLINKVRGILTSKQICDWHGLSSPHKKTNWAGKLVSWISYASKSRAVQHSAPFPIQFLSCQTIEPLYGSSKEAQSATSMTMLPSKASSDFRSLRVRALDNDRYASIACVIEMDGKLYGLTSAHVFYESSFKQSFKQFSNWQADTASREFAAIDHLSGASTGFAARCLLSIENGKHAIETIAWFSTCPDPGVHISGLDWALIALHKVNPDQLLGLSTYKISFEAQLPEDIVTDHPGESRSVRILVSSRPPQSGALMHGISYLVTPGFGTVHLWCIKLNQDQSLRKGDSGSLVIDAKTGKAYGYIVSLGPMSEVQIIPLCSAIGNIKKAIQEANGTISQIDIARHPLSTPSNIGQSSSSIEVLPAMSPQSRAASSERDRISEDASDGGPYPSWLRPSLETQQHSRLDLNSNLSIKQDIRRIDGLLTTSKSAICPSKKITTTPRSSWNPLLGPIVPIFAIFIVSIYSTLFSILWFLVAIIRPHWGHFLSNLGLLSPRVASIIVAGLAKTIEMSFTTVMIICLGQYLTYKAMDNGISLNELQSKEMMSSPLTLITRPGRMRTLHRAGFMGVLCFMIYIVSALYTTASDAIVAPRVIVAIWGRSLGLAASITDGQATMATLPTQLTSTDISFDSVVPSLTDSLAIFSADNLFISTVDTLFNGTWQLNTSVGKANDTLLYTGIQKFPAKIQISDYDSSLIYDWKLAFVVELLLVVIINICALTYFTTLLFGRPLVRQHGITRMPPQKFENDITELREIFTSAIHSPTVGIINKSGAGSGVRWKYQDGVFRPSRLEAKVDHLAKCDEEGL